MRITVGAARLLARDLRSSWRPWRRHCGGRLPGASRLHPDDLDDGAPLTVSAITMGDLTRWAGRLGVEIAAGRS